VTGLDPFRRHLDALDEEIARLLGERFEVCRDIARYKQLHDIPMMQPARVAEVRARYLARGAEVDLPPDFVAALFELLIGATCRMEDELIAAGGVSSDGELSAVPPSDGELSAVPPSSAATPSAAAGPSRAAEPERQGA
jgi:chorismate mutase-like protein